MGDRAGAGADGNVTLPARAACIGKWHLGMEWPLKRGGIASTRQEEAEVDFTAALRGGPTQHGFDYSCGISASLDMPPYVYLENDCPTTAAVRHFEGRDGSARPKRSDGKHHCEFHFG